ncbi:putative holin, partial [Comamonas thiooxydans]
MSSTSVQSLRQSKLPRMTSWWLIALILSLAVFLIAPQQLPVSLYKLNLISLAALAGYWIDRAVFP